MTLKERRLALLAERDRVVDDAMAVHDGVWPVDIQRVNEIDQEVETLEKEAAVAFEAWADTSSVDQGEQVSIPKAVLKELLSGWDDGLTRERWMVIIASNSDFETDPQSAEVFDDLVRFRAVQLCFDEEV